MGTKCLQKALTKSVSTILTCKDKNSKFKKLYKLCPEGLQKRH